MKSKIFNAVSGTCVFVGLGGLGGACDTGKGYFLSICLLMLGFALEKLSSC